MRIIFLSYNYSPVIRSPEEWLDRIKFYIGWNECLAKIHTVIRVDQINYEGNFTHNGIQYYCVDDGKKKNYFPRKLNRFVKELKPDIVLVSSFLFPLQVIQLRKYLGKKVKIILQHHAERPFTGIKKYIQNFASCKVDAFLFTSFETGADWVRNKNLDTYKKVHEMPEVSSHFYPVDKNTARQNTDVSGSPVFLWVGRLNQNKDPLTTVKAFLKFTALHPAAKLFMIYHTSELFYEINKLLSPDSGDSHVVLVGKIQHSELLYWFNSADFFLSASHYEGCGTALCEAMSCGCIPLVSDIPSFRMITGNCGLLFEPGNEDALLSALQQTIHLEVEEKKNNALHRFKTELSFGAISAKFQRIIESL
ncbi:MAG TPA: glycosyltransferase family 4 protein [Puia sp.]